MASKKLEIDELVLANELEQRMKFILENVHSANTNWKSIFRHNFTPDYESNGSFGRQHTPFHSREANIDFVENFFITNPDYRIQITSQSPAVITTESDPPQATTYATADITGLPGRAAQENTIAREGIMVFCWRLKEDGAWWVYRSVAMRGPGAMGI